MENTEIEILTKAADLLRTKSRRYYDIYQNDKYSHLSVTRERAVRNFEVYKQYNRLATEIDVIVHVGEKV